LTDEEKQEIRLLIAQEEAEHVQKTTKQRPLLLKHTEEVARLTARLRYLCRLIVRDRHPYCPLNGILLLLPLAGSDSKEDSEQSGGACQLDLATVRQVLQVHCPLFVMVCDLETAPGFAEFADRFPTEQRQRRVGQRFPLVPDLAEGQSSLDTIDQSVHWICNTLIPSHIYKLFRVEKPGREEVGPVVKGNTRLYQLFFQIRDRQERLRKMIVRGLSADPGGPLLFGGSYVAATGKDPQREQAFIPGVFRRLIENQDYVSWTATGLREEATFQRWTKYGYIGILVGLVLFPVAAFLLLKI
jgi:hypothetical protein